MRSILAIIDDVPLRCELQSALAALGHTMGCDPLSPADVIFVDAGGASRVKRGLSHEIDAPVVLLAETIDADMLAATSAHGAAVLLGRPIIPRELSAAIELAMDHANRARAAALRERSSQATLRSIGDAVITADEANLVTLINPAAQALTGWAELEGLGLPLAAVFSLDKDDQSSAANSPERGGTFVRLRHRDGTSKTIEHSVAPILDGSGVSLGVVVVFRDLSERRRIEQRLALSGRMTSIGTFAAGIAHELNNPLAFVTSNLDFAISELQTMKGDARSAWTLDLLEDSLAALHEAADGAARAAHIVKDLKVFVRNDSEQKFFVDVNRALAFATRLTNNQVRHVGDLQMDLEVVPATLADEGKLVQVFVNLLTNAAQSIDPRKADKHIRVRSSRQGDRIVVRIEDSGCGIAQEHLGQVFEPFFTTKPVGQGLGLGLSISHTLISSFGGTLSLESVPGRGTTAIVSLPISEPVGIPAPRVDGSLAARVLVIDDEALIGTAVRRILTRKGYHVVVEQSARQALELLGAGQRFDAIVCDLMMPGFSGIDFYEALANDKQQSRVILMTGNAFTPRARELFESTGNVRLEKPFLPKDLLGAIAEVLHRHP